MDAQLLCCGCTSNCVKENISNAAALFNLHRRGPHCPATMLPRAQSEEAKRYVKIFLLNDFHSNVPKTCDRPTALRLNIVPSSLSKRCATDVQWHTAPNSPPRQSLGH